MAERARGAPLIDGHLSSVDFPSGIEWRLDPTRGPVLLAVMRRLGPQLIEATLIPSALYYLAVLTVGLKWGVVAVTVWVALAIGRRLVCRQQVPTLLVLAAVGLSIRGGVYFLNENDFVYFVQPIIRTVATAMLFTCSALVGRPLIARFANDFCAFDETVGGRPAICALFRRLTYLWAAALFVTAGVHMTLLLTVPVSVFIGTAMGATWLIIASCVIVTVGDSVRTARKDGLRTAISSGGRLHAVTI